MNNASQTHAVTTKKGRIVRSIALMLASVSLSAPAMAAVDEPPTDVLRKIAVKSGETAKARDNYTYRQSLVLQEIEHNGMIAGEYRETRDVTFSPNGSRYEQSLAAPVNTLPTLKLTPEDFADLRNVQPFMLTTDNIALYRGEYKGEETVDGYPCYVVHVQPKQILSGQRFFEGLLWVRQSDFALVRSQGQAVPQLENTQNLFPHFTTVMRQVDGKWMFPAETDADDTLFFKDWPRHIKIKISYSRYEKFGVEATLKFDGEAAPAPSGTAPPPAVQSSQPASSAPAQPHP
jgi:hypothetical protein